MKIISEYDFKKLDYTYFIFCALRFILTLVPQAGYIHPDEFFQSVEIVAGDVFDLESVRSWEFNSSFPIRSIAIPYLTTGIPLKILGFVDNIFINYFHMSLRTPYFLLIFPRIFLCILSLINDFCLYKICTINSEKVNNKLILLTSSYVIQIYGTHTFSNTFEMMFMSILLYLVVDSQTYSHAIIRQNVYLSKKYNTANKPVDKVRLYKMKASLPSYSTRNCILISFIIVIGTFNRPTFLAFALPSLFFWIHRGIGLKVMCYADIHYRMLIFILNGILFTFLFIIIDSFYYGYLSCAEIIEMDISINNFVVIPFNFIKYNMNSEMLAEHGLHYRITHFLVNMPLLYNILAITATGGFTVFTYRFISGHFTELPRIHSINFLMSASVIYPISVLSYFPHQEQRFLIPVTLPLIYLYADTIMNKKILKRLWWICNTISVIFFGFVHQAGLVPLATYLHKQLQENPNQQIHLVTSYVYSFPLSLLMQQNSKRLYGHDNSKYLLPKSILLHELGSSSSLDSILTSLDVIYNVQNRKNKRKNQNGTEPPMYFTIPNSKELELINLMNKLSVNFTLHKVKTFYPHISTEAFPNIFYNPCNNVNNFTNFSVVHFSTFIFNIVQSCGLALYKIKNVNITI